MCSDFDKLIRSCNLSQIYSIGSISAGLKCVLGQRMELLYSDEHSE